MANGLLMIPFTQASLRETSSRQSAVRQACFTDSSAAALWEKPSGTGISAKASQASTGSSERSAGGGFEP